MGEFTLQQLREVFDPVEQRLTTIEVELRNLKDAINPKIAKHEVYIETLGKDLNGAWKEIKKLRDETKPQRWTVANWLYLIGLIVAITIALIK